MKNLTLSLIGIYQRFLSPSNFGLHTCRFEPSCSHYTRKAVEKYGVLLGGVKGALRVLRCNPFFRGGYDPLV